MAAAVICIWRLMLHRAASRARGVQLLQAFRMLIKHVQVHRGLVAAHASGNENVMDAMGLNVASISSDIESIGQIEEALCDNENWTGITRHWSRLAAPNRIQDVLDNYDQHCKLIANCLHMMMWISLHYRIKPQRGMSEKVYWHELLSLGEKLGQVRALGVMHLSLTHEATVRMRCRAKIRDGVEGLESLFDNRMLQLKIGRLDCEEINNFIALVQHRLLNQNAWITSEQYFSHATETIEIIYRNFDEEMRRLLKGRYM